MLPREVEHGMIRSVLTKVDNQGEISTRGEKIVNSCFARTDFANEKEKDILVYCDPRDVNDLRDTLLYGS